MPARARPANGDRGCVDADNAVLRAIQTDLHASSVQRYSVDYPAGVMRGQLTETREDG